MNWFNNLKLGNKFTVIIVGIAITAVVAFLILGTQVFNLLTEQIGQVRIEQEITLIERHLLQMQEEHENAAVVLANTPGLIDAVANHDEDALRALALSAVPSLNIDDFDIIDTEGERLLDVEDEQSEDESDETEIILQSLIGIQRTTLLEEVRNGETELLLVSIRPLRDANGIVVGGLLIAKELGEDFLDELNFNRSGIELSLIRNNQVVGQTSPEVEDAETENEESSFTLNSDLLSTALAGLHGINPHPTYSNEGILYTEAYIPVRALSDRSAAAALRIGVNNDVITSFGRNLSSAFVVVLPLLSIVSLTLFTTFVRSAVTRRIALLEQATTALAQGDFSKRVDLRGQDEVGQLAQAFNRMADEIYQRDKELSEINQSLEKRVAERTAELKKSRDEALALQRIAQENSRLKSEFLSTMSHELRTPLNAIEGFTSIMLGGMGIELSPRAAEMTRRVSMNSKRLLNLINDFLDLSRIESGRLELVQEPLSPVLLAQKWQKEVGILAEGKGIDFSVEVDSSLPDTLYGDEDALSKIAINLLGNAFKFTKKGSVGLSLNRHDQMWNITVTDTGIGIPVHAREYIFDEFRQVDGSSKREFGGTGLGLALVQKLARAMGGQVSLESEVGVGSTFVVSLPLITEPEGHKEGVLA